MAMPFTPKSFERLLGTPGFSDQLLKNHFTLYEGYVKNTNLLLEKLNALLKENKADTPEFAELKRRFGWEFNGMRLHEYYFENMSNAPAAMGNGLLAKKLKEQFGSLEQFEKDFKSTGKMRGIGWAVLYHDPVSGEMYAVWVNEHDVAHIAGGKVLLIMDVFEHAFMLDYGLKRADYIEAFWKSVDWNVVEERLSGKRVV